MNPIFKVLSLEKEANQSPNHSVPQKSLPLPSVTFRQSSEISAISSYGGQLILQDD